MEASDAARFQGKCRDWKAQRGPGVLVVDGWCTYPVRRLDDRAARDRAAGHRPEGPAAGAGTVTTVPEGYQPPVVRGIEVHFEKVGDFEYETVTIMPDELTLEVDRRRTVTAGEAPRRPTQSGRRVGTAH